MKLRKVIGKMLGRRNRVERRSVRFRPKGKDVPPSVFRVPLRAPRGNGVNIIGHIYQPSGRGEDARAGAVAACVAGIPVALVNTFGEYGKEGKGLAEDSSLRSLVTATNPHDINLFFLNADEMHNAYQHLGPDFYNRKYNIACWAWELSEFPDAWLSSLDLVDEIWAPSRFIQDAIARKTDKPVILMPLVVDYSVKESLPRGFFGIPKDKRVFLSFFDFTSYYERKNPFAVVAAFSEACESGAFARQSTLVIKLNNWEHDAAACRRFERLVRGHDNIHVIKQVLSDHEMKSLVAACDCLVSLHRSEGFGRGPAEAMALGKPVIVTGYSGNMDYCHEANSFVVDYHLIRVREGEYPYGLGQVWADADVSHAACFMREVAAGGENVRAKAMAGQQYVRHFYGPEAVGKRYARRLGQVRGGGMA